MPELPLPQIPMSPEVPGVNVPRPADPSFISKIGTALSNIAPIAGPAGTALNIAGGLMQFIPRKNMGKIEAANLQQNIEKVAMEIERRVMSGEMDPEAALAALDNLSNRARAMGGDTHMQQGGTMADLIIQQVRANIETKRVAGINEPIGERGLHGTPENQRAQFGTLIRNALIGHEKGAGLAGTPAGSLLDRSPSPTARLPELASQVDQTFPNPVDQNFGSQIKERLQQRQARPRELY